MERMTADDFRELVLNLEGTVESSHMSHPDFRANGRIFASLTGDERRGTLGLAPDEQQALIQAHPRTFEPANGAWGRQGWTVVNLQQADVGAVRGAVVLAWQRVLSRPAPRTRSAKKAARPSARKARS